MSVNGALFAGVSGLKAESSTLGVISNNISNANTVGYKAGTGQFATLVTDTGSGGAGFSPGGVLAKPVQMIDAQGLLQATSSSTDVGITGRGFFVVANQLTATGTVASTTPRDFTRAGSFTLDKSGNLVNTAGYFLLGVPTDTQGNPVVANPVVEGLQPVNVGTLTGIAKGTSQLSIGANLPAVPSSPSHLKISGSVDGINSFLDPEHYVMYSSKGNAYDCQIFYKQTGSTSSNGTLTSATYDIQLANMTPIGTSPAIDTTKSSLPVTIGTVNVTGGNGTVSGGTAISFQDGSTLQPVLDGSNLHLNTSLGNQLDRAAIDAQDITTTVYDSLGVAHSLTVEMSRGSDLSRTLSSPINNIGLSGTLDTATILGSGTTTVSLGTTLLTASDGTVYQATLQLNVTAANAADLQATSLVPVGPGTVTDPALAFPLKIATLAINAGGTTVTPTNPTVDAAATVKINLSNASQPNLKDSAGATTSVQNMANNATFTLPNPAVTANEWLTSIRDMRIAATGQPSVTFPMGAVTGFPIYLDGSAASALGTLTNADNIFSLSGSYDTAGAAQLPLGQMRVVSTLGNAYDATLILDPTVPDIEITKLTAIGNSPAITLAANVQVATITVGGPPNTLTAAAQYALSATDNLKFDVSTQAVNLNAAAAASNAPVLKCDVQGSSTSPPTAALSTSVVKFNNDGTIATGAPNTIPALTMATGAKAFGGPTFTLNLGTPNTAGGLTQFTDQFAVSFLNQDGVRFGFRTGVSFNKDGLVSAVFDNGQSIALFKVPLVNFANVNQLQAITGDVFGQTTDSGDPVPNFPGVGGTGSLTPSTLEQSTVDLSTEFANLIVTQRSFSADARTITTSDAMLQELIDIKR